MNAQLVLQFPASTSADFERFVSFEELLEERLASPSTVDGHDLGCGEFNIFIFTGEPHSTFQRVLEIANTQGLSDGMRAGYRRSEDDDYSPLWPQDLTTFSVS